jgi:uncharacterized protein YukE
MNENHKRVLTSDLLIIEERLHQISQELQQMGKESDAVLQSAINDIDPETRIKMLNIAGSMLDEIRQIKELFSLEVVHGSLRWHIIALLSEIWNTLDALKPEKVGRVFGEMPNNVQEAWKPHISRLSNMLDELYQELG